MAERIERTCKRCGALIATDHVGQWANISTLSYRCLEVGKAHEPLALEDIPGACIKLQRFVDDLADELPGLTLGYIGNIEWGPQRDDREWKIFLPHPGRVGTLDDSVTLGETHELPRIAEGDLSLIAAKVRLRYYNGTRRVQEGLAK